MNVCIYCKINTKIYEHITFSEMMRVSLFLPRLDLKNCGKISIHTPLVNSSLACQLQIMTVYKRKSMLPFTKAYSFILWGVVIYIIYDIYKLINLWFLVFTPEKSLICYRNSMAYMMQLWVRSVGTIAFCGQMWISRRSILNFWNFKTGNWFLIL